jgi:hypothetical protein
LIDGIAYNAFDTNAPAFGQNDSVRIKDNIHGVIIRKFSAANGNMIWEKSYPLEQYNDGYYKTSLSLLNNGIIISNSNTLHFFDLNGNHLNQMSPIYNNYGCQNEYLFSVPTYDNDHFILEGRVDTNSSGYNLNYFAKLDISGNVIWKKDGIYSLSYKAFTTVNNGFFTTDRLYDNNGNLIKEIGLFQMLLLNGTIQSPCLLDGYYYEFAAGSCSGDLLFVLDKYDTNCKNKWLARTNSNGNL